MRQQLRVGKERKKKPIFAETGSKEGQSPEISADDEIDPADFFDPEEFGIRRKHDSYRA